jgi:hypothetical protein
MTAIDILLMIEFNTIKKINMSNHLVKIISSLKYFETYRSSSVIYQLISVIDHPLLSQDAYRKIIIKAFCENIDKLDLSLNKSGRKLIESIYSLSMLIRRYYDMLIEKEIAISDKFIGVIEELRHSKLKEVRYMWEDVHFK